MACKLLFLPPSIPRSLSLSLFPFWSYEDEPSGRASLGNLRLPFVMPLCMISARDVPVRIVMCTARRVRA